MTMSDLLDAVQPWLDDREEVVCFAGDLVFAHVSEMDRLRVGDEKWEGLVLTNRRLIFVSRDRKYLQSTAGIVRLVERLRGVNPKWPYRATIALSGGGNMIVETAKVDMDVRGRALSILLRRALIVPGV
jgi:hypothetical protein